MLPISTARLLVQTSCQDSVFTTLYYQMHQKVYLFIYLFLCLIFAFYNTVFV